MTLLGIVKPHDGRDIGWRKTRHAPLLHWFRSNTSAKVAMAHCQKVEYKAELQEARMGKYCPYCKMVEDERTRREGLE